MIGTGCLIALMIFLFLYSSYTATCDYGNFTNVTFINNTMFIVDDFYDKNFYEMNYNTNISIVEEKYCSYNIFYYNQTEKDCYRMNGNYNSDNYECVFKKRGFMNRPLIWIIIGLIAIIIGVIYGYKAIKPFERKQILSPDVAKMLVVDYHARESCMPLNNGHYIGKDISTKAVKRDFVDRDQNFALIQLECVGAGDNDWNGLFVYEVPLNDGKEGVLFGSKQVTLGMIDTYKRSRMFPLAALSETERMLRDIERVDPEEAARVQKEQVMKRLEGQGEAKGPSESVPSEGQPPPSQTGYRPPVYRRQPRRYGYRRY